MTTAGDRPSEWLSQFGPFEPLANADVEPRCKLLQGEIEPTVEDPEAAVGKIMAAHGWTGVSHSDPMAGQVACWMPEGSPIPPEESVMPWLGHPGRGGALFILERIDAPQRPPAHDP